MKTYQWFAIMGVLCFICSNTNTHPMLSIGWAFAGAFFAIASATIISIKKEY